MSENILIGKNRKTGNWEILVQPGQPYDAHLKAYQKLASASPVSDVYSAVRLGRVQNTSTPLTLITSEENKTRLALAAKSLESAANSANTAEDRQKAIDKAMADKVAERHAEALKIKAEIIADIREASGQSAAVAPPPPPVTKTEEKK